jgi:hypothetical protein
MRARMQRSLARCTCDAVVQRLSNVRAALSTSFAKWCVKAHRHMVHALQRPWQTRHFADDRMLQQGEAIAVNLREMFGFRVPIFSIVIGEGGSGGALAIGCANRLVRVLCCRRSAPLQRAPIARM